MAINLHLPSQLDTLRPKITVIGVGGAGGNAVNNMIAANLEGVDFVIANTDAQALESALTENIVVLGTNATRGLGAGAKPSKGREAAEEAAEELAQLMEGSNMVFITAGMGGGTGTGAAPVIAQLAKDQGILTVGVVTKPFQFEGTQRMRTAESGIEELQKYVDTLIIIPNQNLFRIANEKTTFAEAFRLADEVLHSGVRGVTDLIVKPGLVNRDFADIRTVMSEMGKAMMGTGEATGASRALQAAEAAISNPLLDDVSLKGARAVLINITGGSDMTLFEVDEAANRIRDEVDAEANIIFGSTFSDALEGKMRVSVVATGIGGAEALLRPTTTSDYPTSHATQPLRKPALAVTNSPVAVAPVPIKKDVPTGRSAADIVRQSGGVSANDIARVAAPRVTASTPVIRIVDESVQTQETQQLAANAQQQAAALAASQATQLEQAMRLAAGSARATQSSESSVFVSPRAEQPVQRTLFAAASPEFEEEEEEIGAARGNIFGRLANVGKAIANSARNDARATREALTAAPQPERKAEVREAAPHAQDEDEMYDIPAFLRRQAN